jgi:hypothetical protein
MQSKDLNDPKGTRNMSVLLVFYKKMDVAPTHATSKTRPELLTSNRNALEADGTGRIEDSPAMFFTATTLWVGVAVAVVIKKPCSLYDFGSAVAPAAAVMTVKKP